MYTKIRKSENVTGIICLTVFLFLIVGCAAWKVSPEHTYLKALRHFNNTVEIYEENYQLQTPEIQAKWKEQIDPLVKITNTSLNAWGIAINNSQAEINYRGALANLIQGLFSIGIVEVKEK